MTKPILKILLVDDQKFVQLKLQEMLSAETDLQIVGVASDGETAIAQAESLQPDVVLIDIEMPKMNGIEATKIISQRFPECKILILSSHEQQEYVQKIIAAGADGYVLKSIQTEDLVLAICSVCRGYSHFGSQLLKKIQLAPDLDRSTPVSQTESAMSGQYSTDGGIANFSRLESRLADDLLPPASKWLTWGGISAMVLVILTIPASAIFRYKTVVKAQAVVRPVEELHSIQAAVEGRISEILVEEGQKIEQGEAIATIERSRFQTRSNLLATAIERQELQLALLNAQIASLSSQIMAETERNQAEIAAANSELAGSQRNYKNNNAEAIALVEEFQAQIQAVKAALDTAEARYSRYQYAASEGIISQERLTEAKLDVERQEQEQKVAQAKLRRANASLNPSKAEIKISRQRIEQAKKSGKVAIARFKQEKEALTQQRLETEKKLSQDGLELNQVNKELAKTSIIATATGTIFQLNLRNPQQTVKPGQEIARIIPSDSELEMKAEVPTQDINRLKIGQPVQMRVSACPYPDYGVLKGTVTHIARDTNNSTTQKSETQPFYEVAITPKTNIFGRSNYSCTLQLGMQSQADIISRSETVLQFILRKARLIGNV